MTYMYNVKVLMKTDMSEQEMPDIQIDVNPKLAGNFEIWGWSMNCWEIDVFHEPVQELERERDGKTWTVLDARDDSIVEYGWWFDNYQQVLVDYDAMHILDARPPFERSKGSRAARYYLNKDDNRIPITLHSVDGLSNARWLYRTDIADLLDMEKPPSKKEWLEAVLSLHNDIVEGLNPEWDKVKEFY